MRTYRLVILGRLLSSSKPRDLCDKYQDFAGINHAGNHADSHFARKLCDSLQIRPSAFTLFDQVFLEGDLERGIVPEDSVWMHGGGSGEDGCLLLLRKMNLELLRR